MTTPTDTGLPSTDIPAVYVLHENHEWWPPFAAAFERAGVPVVPWNLVAGELDLDRTPPEGVFWSRISASSHTRGHVLSKDFARSVLSWLEGHGRTTVNGRRAIELEVSKVHQLSRLAAHGIDVPRTISVVGQPTKQTLRRLDLAAQALPTPFITKHNQGGKGLGVRRFDSHAAFRTEVERIEEELNDPERRESALADWPVDGILLLQEYLRPAGGFISRAEFVGDRHLYTLAADTVHGGFQLCPADACEVDPVSGRPVVPPGAEAAPAPGQAIFSLREGFTHPVLDRYRDFLAAEGVGIAGVEFIETDDARIVAYDVNTNTNYNPDVEKRAQEVGIAGGPDSIVAHLGRLLSREVQLGASS
ncbi:alpha-L-glutamate ligase [Galactobacter sp.]|uniref:ATP-grasp domain-containing protein n=1 Tax=Galactobacter sp. TaxID=2676125 RepID=UPI0025C42C2E|nr:alpha-L-glutamate ligase [Galactobacter sp.]